MKRLMVIMMGLLIAVGMVGVAHSATSDQLTITIQPTSEMDIVISTDDIDWVGGTSGLDLTNVSMGTTDYFVKPATVTYTGSITL